MNTANRFIATTASFCFGLLMSAGMPAGALAAERTIDGNVTLGNTRLASTWYVPNDAAASRGFVVLLHGFARNKDNMRDLASRLQDKGYTVLTPTVGLGSLNSDAFLAGAALDLAKLQKIPDTDVALPSRLVVAGHSAGGKNALVIGAALRATLGERMAGILLLDPVERDGAMQRAFASLGGSETDVLTLLARPGACNAGGNAAPLLKDFASPFKGVRMTKGTHCDAEGSSTNFLCKVACGNSSAATVTDTQEFAVNWIEGFFEGTRRAEFFPGGARYDALVGSQDGEAIE